MSSLAQRAQHLLSGARRLGAELGRVARHADAPTTRRYAAAVMTQLPEILRERSLAPADRAMAGHSVTIADPGLVWPGANFGLIRELAWRRVYEAVPGFDIHPGDRVVDIGANCGLFSCLAARRGAHVLAIEAQHGFITELERNAAANGLAERIRPHWCMVGSDAGVISAPGAWQRASHAEGRIPPTRDLAALLDAEGFTRVALLKVDIEGSEFSLFRDAEAWLPRIDRIVAEAHGEWGDVRELTERFSSAGFLVERRSADLGPAPGWSAESQYLFARRPER